jgi:leucyl aminopeptidase
MFQKAMEELCSCGVQVDVRDSDWLEHKGLKALLKIGKGCSPPLMLELSYCGGGEGDKPVVLVGKNTSGTLHSNYAWLSRGHPLLNPRTGSSGWV